MRFHRDVANSGGMLVTKACHDLDLIAWMKSGIAPVAVASYGSNYQFRQEKAPERAGTRCLVDCPIELTCLYSARKHYIDHPDRWVFYVWEGLEHLNAPTIEDKIAYLKGDTLYIASFLSSSASHNCARSNARAIFRFCSCDRSCRD